MSNKLTTLMELILDSMDSREDVAEMYSLLPTAAAMILAQTPIGTGEITGEEEDVSVSYLTSLATGNKAVVTVDYDPLPFIQECLMQGIEEVGVGSYVIFNGDKVENNTGQEEKKVLH